MNIKKYSEEELKKHKKAYDVNYIKNRYKNDINFKNLLKEKAKLYYIKSKYKKFIKDGNDPNNFFHKGINYKF
jgi:hypothetical protein